MQLNESQWMFINDIIYKFNAHSDFDEARSQFLTDMHLLIPYNGGSFYLSDKNNPGTICKPIVNNLPIEGAQNYMNSAFNIDYAKWLFTTSESKAYNPNNWFPEGNNTGTSYFQMFSALTHLHYSILLSLAYENKFMGIVCLYRSQEQNDFTEKDLFILETFKKHLALRIWKEEFCRRASSAATVSDITEEKITDLLSHNNFTTREEEVLRLLISGMTINEISENLSISENTLRTHSKNIYQKLGINRRSELNKFLT